MSGSKKMQRAQMHRLGQQQNASVEGLGLNYSGESRKEWLEMGMFRVPVQKIPCERIKQGSGMLMVVLDEGESVMTPG